MVRDFRKMLTPEPVGLASDVGAVVVNVSDATVTPVLIVDAEYSAPTRQGSTYFRCAGWSTSAPVGSPRSDGVAALAADVGRPTVD